jgi:HAD superfamily hydrolase (TIGR01509 family)
MSQSTPAIQALIFDMDGLLVDPEPYARAARVALVRDHGRAWRPEPDGSVQGRRLRDVMGIIARSHDLDAPLDELCAGFESRVSASRRGELRPLPGAEEVMAFGRTAELRLALASSGWRHYVDAILTEAGLAGAFDTEVTGGDVQRGKPAPDPFLLAAARLGVPPAACVVFEDAPAGVAAAAAAGMRSVAVHRRSTRNAPFPVVPDITIDSLHEAIPWLQAQGVGHASIGAERVAPLA